jgi:beta-galactosidase
MSKINLITLSVLSVAVCILAPIFANAQTSVNPRIRYTINDSWKFYREDVNQAEALQFKDTSWNKINIPHTWNVEDARDDTPGYYHGIGWYRKNLFIGKHLQGKKLFLHFESANQETEVFVNGQKVGNHIGGYTAYTFDISDEVKFDAENLIWQKTRARFSL